MELLPSEKSSRNSTKPNKQDDFYWSLSEEPHKSRRKIILSKYPQIKDLFGYDPNTKYFVTLAVIVQISLAVYLRNASALTLILVAWSIGGTINHYLNLSIHEITHNLAFEKPLHNRLFAMSVANLPLGLASTITFQKYHMEHHLYQGVDGIDMDIPTSFEGHFFTSAPRKLVWLFLQPLFYTLRPLLLKPKPIGTWELLNWTIQLTFDAVLIYFAGIQSYLYLLASTFLGLGIHPMAGHFIAEHYVFAPRYETYSYYGPLNIFGLNVGYHNEHHDFPRIPGSRLPQVREIAAEFYQDLPVCESWVKVLWDYIMTPSIGPFSRVKRSPKKQE